MPKDKDAFVPVTLRLAVIDFNGGRRPEAYKRIEEILKQQPKNEQTLESKTRFLLLDGKNEAALALANSLVAANPKSLRGQYLRGLALEATGSLEDATSTFQQVRQGAPNSVPVQAKLAALYLRQNNPKAALPLAEQVVKAQPQSVMAHFDYARALLGSGDVSNAERELLQLARAAPSSSEVHTWLGLLYDAKHDATRARASYQKAFELDPRSPAALAGLVGADLAAKKPDAAIARIQSQLAQHPNDVRLVSMSGLAYMSIRDLPKAEAAYRKVIELDPANLDAYGKLGEIYVSERRLDEAKKSFEDLAKHQAKPVAAETMIGTILVVQNKVPEARSHFRRAVELDPRAAVAANNLAWDYANNGGNLDVALQLAQTAKSELPENAEVNDTLGWIYYKKGLAGPAVTALSDAARLSPANPGVHYRLGLAYLQGGKKSEARATLQQVLKLNPQFPEAAEVRRVLATIEG